MINKFRAWDLRLKKFDYFDLFSVLPIYKNKDEFIVQSFIGSMDSNGVDTYEGDIIETNNFIATVKYNGCCYYLDFMNSSGWAMNIPEPICDYNIIGNIFENNGKRHDLKTTGVWKETLLI